MLPPVEAGNHHLSGWLEAMLKAGEVQKRMDEQLMVNSKFPDGIMVNHSMWNISDLAMGSVSWEWSLRKWLSSGPKNIFWVFFVWTNTVHGCNVGY